MPELNPPTNGHAQNRRHVVAEFMSALSDPFTYNAWRNHEVLFGFLWGLPIPFFVWAIHVHASGMKWELASCCNVIAENPAYIFFLLHPFIFAIIFGALGTMRARREMRIQHLVDEVKARCQELTTTNARLEDLDRLKSEFLANVTHELKSPLVTAIGYNDRILDGRLGDINEKQKKGLEVSKRNLIRLRNLIEEILDFSRLEAGVSRFEMRPIMLNSVVHTALENVALRARERRIALNDEYPATAAWVLGDAGKLIQVVVNLLDNAIKFSQPQSHVRVVLGSDGEKWRLRVIDNGCGIPAEKLPHLFERFFQADGSLSKSYDGVGLGLVIVKKIIEAHGGTISVESKTGADSGTTMTIVLPAEKPAKTPSIAAEPVAAEAKEVAHATHSAD